jgi:lipid-A-disaccharide synthase
MGETFTIGIVAGESSGDAHAGALARQFEAQAPGSRWFGAGGPALRSAGAEVLVSYERLAVVGIGEVLTHLPQLFRAMGQLKRALRERRPDALVLVDFPDFNFRLAKYAHKLGIPVVYYITPQVWAWRSGRTRFFEKYVDRAFVLFPFEKDFFEAHGVAATFVGHPLVDTLKPDSSLEAFLSRHHLDPETPRLAFLPGSRTSEVKRHLSVMMEACREILETFPDTAVFVPWAHGLPQSLREPFRDLPVRWVEGEYRDVLGHADAAVVASGTASLEGALMGVPEVVVYRLNRLTFKIVKRMVNVPHAAMPNVVLGRGAIPELIQDDFTPARVAQTVSEMLKDRKESGSRARELAGEIKKQLGEGNASARAARELVDFLKTVSRP